MAVLHVFKVLDIQSHRGIYQVLVGQAQLEAFVTQKQKEKIHVIIDKKVAALHQEVLSPLLDGHSILEISASEGAKSLEALPLYVEELMKANIHRGDLLIGIGGGVIQDITAFLASCIHRGMDWSFVPTTLLAQADSCIGSKTSINCGAVKNIIGTFCPPRKIIVAECFLATLEIRDIRSGIGEILKANAIQGPTDFDIAANDIDEMLENGPVLQRHICHALEIKKHFIEADEFDRNERNLFNYGHTFGHALEAATDFRVPHGIAVSIGMDMANFYAMNQEFITESEYLFMHNVLEKVYFSYRSIETDRQKFERAISRDKKIEENNVLNLILPTSNRKIKKVRCQKNYEFFNLCQNFLNQLKALPPG